MSAQLQAGMPAPLFTAQDLSGSKIELAKIAGKPVLLSFYRNAVCALCNLQMHQLIERYPDYHHQGLEVLTVFESPRQNLLQYAGQQAPPFAMIADPEAALYDLYGVETSEEKVKQSLASEITKRRTLEASQHGFELTKEEGANFYRMPADFLIGPDLVIEAVFYSSVVGEHMPFDHIEQTLAQWAVV